MGKARNVILLHTDQQRADSMGCMGNRFARTPNLDRLAAGGSVFTRHIASNPICMPSRVRPKRKIDSAQRWRGGRNKTVMGAASGWLAAYCAVISKHPRWGVKKRIPLPAARAAST